MSTTYQEADTGSRISTLIPRREDSMARISEDQDVVTLINVFAVEPDHQQPLVDLLV
jgi:hypothetical protein